MNLHLQKELSSIIILQAFNGLHLYTFKFKQRFLGKFEKSNFYEIKRTIENRIAQTH